MADPHELLLPEVRVLGDCLHREGDHRSRRKNLNMQATAQDTSKADRTAFLILFVLLLALTVGLVALSFPAGIYAVFSGRLSTLYTYATLVRPYFWLGPVFEVAPFTANLGAVFLVFLGAYLALLMYSVREKAGPVAAVSASFREGVGALTSSPFIVAMVSIGFFTFTASAIDQVVSAVGVPIGGPTDDPMSLLFGTTVAPLVEEFGFRVLLIGAVAFILSISRPWKAALASLWRPSKAIEGFAVGSGASVIIWAATGFSAATFGACHVLCGNTWDIGKLPEALYGGVVLGYLYVRYGFHVAVLTHWGLNFVGNVYAFFGLAAYGVPMTSGTTEYLGQYLVDIDMLFLFGTVSFLLVVYLGVRKLARWRSGEFDKGPLGGVGVEP